MTEELIDALEIGEQKPPPSFIDISPYSRLRGTQLIDYYWSHFLPIAISNGLSGQLEQSG